MNPGASLRTLNPEEEEGQAHSAFLSCRFLLQLVERCVFLNVYFVELSPLIGFECGNFIGYREAEKQKLCAKCVSCLLNDHFYMKTLCGAPLWRLRELIPQGSHGVFLHQITSLVMKLLSNHQNQSDKAAVSQPSVGLRQKNPNVSSSSFLSVKRRRSDDVTDVSHSRFKRPHIRYLKPTGIFDSSLSPLSERHI